MRSTLLRLFCIALFAAVPAAAQNATPVGDLVVRLIASLARDDGDAAHRLFVDSASVLGVEVPDIHAAELTLGVEPVPGTGWVVGCQERYGDLPRIALKRLEVKYRNHRLMTISAVTNAASLKEAEAIAATLTCAMWEHLPMEPNQGDHAAPLTDATLDSTHGRADVAHWVQYGDHDPLAVTAVEIRRKGTAYEVGLRTTRFEGDADGAHED
jgi:hypothetical protein